MIAQAAKDTALARVLMVHGDMYSQETLARCAALLDMLLSSGLDHRWYCQARETIESFGLLIIYPGEHHYLKHHVL